MRRRAAGDLARRPGAGARTAPVRLRQSAGDRRARAAAADTRCEGRPGAALLLHGRGPRDAVSPVRTGELRPESRRAARRRVARLRRQSGLLLRGGEGSAGAVRPLRLHLRRPDGLLRERLVRRTDVGARRASARERQCAGAAAAAAADRHARGAAARAPVERAGRDERRRSRQKGIQSRSRVAST